MTIQTNTNDRKALANAIAAVLGTTVRYTGVPACSYVVGDYTVDRQGNITGEDCTPLHDFLVANGYIAAENADAGSEEPPEENTGTENVAADSGAAEPTPAATTSGIEEQTITTPTPDITVEQLQNLSVSNMTAKRLAEELYKAREYETLEVEHPEGEYTMGKDGFVQFHMKDGAAVQWVLNHLYSIE